MATSHHSFTIATSLQWPPVYNRHLFYLQTSSRYEITLRFKHTVLSLHVWTASWCDMKESLIKNMNTEEQCRCEALANIVIEKQWFFWTRKIKMKSVNLTWLTCLFNEGFSHPKCKASLIFLWHRTHSVISRMNSGGCFFIWL